MAEWGNPGGENKYQEQAKRVRNIPMLTVGSNTEPPKLNKQTDTKVLPQVNAGFMTMALVS